MDTAHQIMKSVIKNIREKFFSGGTSALLFQATANFKALSGNEVSGSRLFSGVFNGSIPDLPTFLNKAFELAIAIGAILAVLRILYGGMLYMGTDTFGKKSKAKEILQDAVLGLLLLLGTYIILEQINPEILNLNINPPSVQTGTSQ